MSNVALFAWLPVCNIRLQRFRVSFELHTHTCVTIKVWFVLTTYLAESGQSHYSTILSE